MKIFRKVFKVQSGQKSPKKIPKYETKSYYSSTRSLHRNDLFDITVKSHEHIMKDIQVKMYTDGRMQDSLLYPTNLSVGAIKRERNSLCVSF